MALAEALARFAPDLSQNSMIGLCIAVVKGNVYRTLTEKEYLLPTPTWKGPSLSVPAGFDLNTTPSYHDLPQGACYKPDESIVGLQFTLVLCALLFFYLFIAFVSAWTGFAYEKVTGINELKDEVAYLEGTCERKSEENTILVAAIDCGCKTLLALQTKFEALSTLAQQGFIKERQAFDDHLVHVKGVMKASDKTITGLREYGDSMFECNQLLLEEYKQLGRKHQDLSEKHRLTIETAANEKLRADTTHTKSLQQAQELTISRTEVEVVKKQLDDSNTQHDSQIDMLTVELRMEREKSEAISADLTQTRAELCEQKGHSQALENDKKQLAENLERTEETSKARFNELKDTRDRAANDLSEAQALSAQKLREFEATIAEGNAAHESDMGEVVAGLEALEVDKERLAMRITALEKEKKAAEERHTTELERAKVRREHQVSQIREQEKKVRQEEREKYRKLEEDRKWVQSRLDADELLLQKLRAKLSKENEHVKDLEAETRRLGSMIEDLEDSIVDNDAVEGSLRMQLTQLQRLHADCPRRSEQMRLQQEELAAELEKQEFQNGICKPKSISI